MRFSVGFIVTTVLVLLSSLIRAKLDSQTQTQIQGQAQAQEPNSLPTTAHFEVSDAKVGPSVAANGHISTSTASPSPAAPSSPSSSALDSENVAAHCFEDKKKGCKQLAADCLKCHFNYSCVYGETVNVTCEPRRDLLCRGDAKFERSHRCAYCYQFPESEYVCSLNASCRTQSRYLTHCYVGKDVLCLGNRVFPKYQTCNFVSGYKWSTALLLSITLGGFGVDRFYLGNWQEGVGKLFSFGGLGVWTLVDVILIATGYLKPGDGSRYI